MTPADEFEFWVDLDLPTVTAYRGEEVLWTGTLTDPSAV